MASVTDQKLLTTPLRVYPPAAENWISLLVPVPANILEMTPKLRAKHPDAMVRSTPGVGGEDPHHITLCYGFDAKQHFEIARSLVEAAKICAEDLAWGEPYSIEPPHLRDKGLIVLCVDVFGPKLDFLKAQIVKATGVVNPAEAHHQRRIPFHVTLQILARTAVAGET